VHDIIVKLLQALESGGCFPSLARFFFEEAHFFQEVWDFGFARGHRFSDLTVKRVQRTAFRTDESACIAAAGAEIPCSRGLDICNLKI